MNRKQIKKQYMRLKNLMRIYKDCNFKTYYCNMDIELKEQETSKPGQLFGSQWINLSMFYNNTKKIVGVTLITSVSHHYDTLEDQAHDMIPFPDIERDDMYVRKTINYQNRKLRNVWTFSGKARELLKQFNLAKYEKIKQLFKDNKQCKIDIRVLNINEYRKDVIMICDAPNISRKVISDVVEQLNNTLWDDIVSKDLGEVTIDEGLFRLYIGDNG